MKRTFLFLSLIFILAVSVSAFGSPLRLDYFVEPIKGGPGFNYQFDLVLENLNNNWKSDQGWGAIVFGDERSAASDLADFRLTTSLPVGPFDLFGSTGGTHNGPTLFNVPTSLWFPQFVGDSLGWSGTAGKMLPQGQLLFSTLKWENGVPAEWEVANRLKQPPGTVPESATLLLLGVGLLGLVSAGRRKVRLG